MTTFDRLDGNDIDALREASTATLATQLFRLGLRNQVLAGLQLLSTAETRMVLPSSITVGAYVTVLPPVEPSTVPAHIERLLTAGAQQLNLYHLGLAGPDRQPALRALNG